MKKYIAMFILVVLILTGCGNKKETKKEKVNNENILTCDFKEDSRTINTVFTFEQEEVSKIDIVMTFYDEDTAKAFYELIKSQGLNYGTLNKKVITIEATGEDMIKEVGLLNKKDEIKNHYEYDGYTCK